MLWNTILPLIPKSGFRTLGLGVIQGGWQLMMACRYVYRGVYRVGVYPSVHLYMRTQLYMTQYHVHVVIRATKNHYF